MDLRRALTEIGALPVPLVSDHHSTGSVLSGLHRAWTAASDSARCTTAEKGHRVSRQLAAQIATGGEIEFLHAADPHDTLAASFGHRLLWWPSGKNSGRRITLSSSRIGRQHHQRPEWFETLRLATSTLQPGEAFLTTPGATTHPFLSRLCELFNLPRIEVRLASPRQPAQQWFQWVLKNVKDSRVDGVRQVFVSPGLTPGPQAESSGHHRQRHTAGIADRDLAIHLLADSIWVLWLRNQGSVLNLLTTGLKCSPFPPDSVRLLSGPGLVTSSLAASLQELGAVTWFLSPADSTADELKGTRSHSSSDSGISPLPQPPGPQPDQLLSASIPTWSDSAGEQPVWLTHCTRRTETIGHNASSHESLDSILLSRPADHSPLGTLRQILSQGLLRASSAAIRGSYPVVCFSACPLQRLLTRRRWQKHRVRWDFEPFGLCIRGSVLTALGARPVVYGDEHAWQTLDTSNRPWFQKRYSTCGTRQIDWSTEREWRILGDVSLSRIRSDDAFVFVPSESAAASLRPLSRWPVKSVVR